MTITIGSLYFIAALVSRTAVVCITLGFVTLLAMVIVAVYKSKQPDPFIKESQKTMHGMCTAVFLNFNWSTSKLQ